MVSCSWTAHIQQKMYFKLNPCMRYGTGITKAEKLSIFQVSNCIVCICWKTPDKILKIIPFHQHNPLNPKIWLTCLPSRCYIFPYKLEFGVISQRNRKHLIILIQYAAKWIQRSSFWSWWHQLIKPSVLITNLFHNVLKFSGDLRCSSLLGVIRVNTRPLY